MSPARILYRLATPEDWGLARAQGELPLSEADRRDGFIHLSSETQALATAQRHFAQSRGLYALELDGEALSGRVKYEPSGPCGTELFPHLYGPLDISCVRNARRLERDEDGAWRFCAQDETEAGA